MPETQLFRSTFLVCLLAIAFGCGRPQASADVPAKNPAANRRALVANHKRRTQNSALQERLVSAMCENDTAAIERLINQGADPNGLDKHGRLPLQLVCDFSNAGQRLKIAKCLLKNGAKLDVRSPRDGWQPIHTAAWFGRVDLLKLFISSGADPKAKAERTPTYEKGWNATSLHVAAWNYKLKVVEFLIGQGVPVDIRDGRGNTPLHAAASRPFDDTVTLLLRLKADPRLKNRAGETALDVANRRKWPKNAAAIKKHLHPRHKK